MWDGLQYRCQSHAALGAATGRITHDFRMHWAGISGIACSRCDTLRCRRRVAMIENLAHISIHVFSLEGRVLESVAWCRLVAIERRPDSALV
jgi:hypothetical protein